MQQYASTFISGLQKPVANLLKGHIPDVIIEKILDGLIIYKTDADRGSIAKLRFFNNTFLVLGAWPDTPHSRDPLGKLLSHAITMPDWEQHAKPCLPDGRHGFRVFVSEENRLVSTDRDLLRRLEIRISQIPGKELKPTSHNPQVEFWILHRSERIGFFMLRLTRNVESKDLHAGELRPELAHILCALSDPHPEDVFLDPFSGYGSIPIERARSFPCRMVFAGDRDENCRQYIRQRLISKKLKKLVIPKQLDACRMTGLEDEFISAIVTDPPWGFHEKVGDIGKFYSQMLVEFYRVLKHEGRLVVLTARKTEFEHVLSAMKDRFVLRDKYDILLSGQKAGVYRLIKSAGAQ